MDAHERSGLPSVNILHVMNSSFGRVDRYGGRSKFIADSAPDWAKITVFSDRNSYTYQRAGLENRLFHPSLRHVLWRKAMARLNSDMGKRRAIWRGFDTAISKMVRDIDLVNTELLHTWEWIPETIRAVRRRNPDITIIRDVVVNRYNEYYSETPITEEDRYVDVFVSPSSFTTAFLTDLGISRSKIHEIPFGVDSDAFRPSRDRAAGPVRFAFVGSISKRKGCDTLLTAWQELGLSDAELHLYGRFKEGLERQIYGVKNLHHHGHVPREKLEKELPQNDVFVFPSTLEGSAKAVYEALACGLPVITTPNAGSIVRDAEDGLIVPPGDPAALSAAIKKLYDAPELRARMGLSARALAEDYSWERYARGIWAAYENILEERSR